MWSCKHKTCRVVFVKQIITNAKPFKKCPSGNVRYHALIFTLTDDKKELGAARRSRYYMKYGNPNYGGMKGILSNSW